MFCFPFYTGGIAWKCSVTDTVGCGKVCVALKVRECREKEDKCSELHHDMERCLEHQVI